jgi:oxygen-independent coproporphyrinogen-3 oxidase
MTGPLPNALGLYVSIPFCRSKCTYCNFASGVYPAASHEPYMERVIADLRGARSWAEGMGVELPRAVDSIYLGGGTPSLLEAELIDRLFAAMRAEFEVDAEAEITIECAPAQLAEEALQAFLRAGVNRVSLGVQSFIDGELRVSGRLHTRATAVETIARLRAAGITNLNVDLIAGLAGQTESSWEESLTALAELDLPHASVYMLEVDEDSRLGRELLEGGARYHAAAVPNDEVIANLYTRALEQLAAAGLLQYEISNLSRAGFASRHNLRYWQRRPYLGLGLDASSMLKDAGGDAAEASKAAGKRAQQSASGAKARRDAAPVACGQNYGSPHQEPNHMLRTTTTTDLTAYLAGSEPAETAWLSPDRQHEEAWFLGLRMNAGVEIAAVEREFGPQRVQRARAALERLAGSGWIDFDGCTARLTSQGRLFSNEVFQEFLGAGEE